MPITYRKEIGWEITEASPEEINALIEIGKHMIVEGLAGAYTNERYKQFLIHAPKGTYFTG